MSYAMDRGTGETTRQMRKAPQGALFIWCNGHTWYPKALAKAIGRDDLDVQPLSALSGHLRGKRWPAIVIDHAAKLSRLEREEFAALKASAL